MANEILLGSLEFQTPVEVCEYMVGLLPAGVERVLEPTPGLGNLVSVLDDRGYKVVVPPGDIFDCDGKFWIDFDAAVANPPFSPMKTGYRILDLCMRNAENVVILLPWLALINSTKRTSAIMQYGLVSITHLPRSVFPGSRVQTCILVMKRGYRGITLFKTF